MSGFNAKFSGNAVKRLRRDGTGSPRVVCPTGGRDGRVRVDVHAWLIWLGLSAVAGGMSEAVAVPGIVERFECALRTELSGPEPRETFGKIDYSISIDGESIIVEGDGIRLTGVATPAVLLASGVLHSNDGETKFWTLSIHRHTLAVTRTFRREARGVPMRGSILSGHCERSDARAR